MTGHSGLKVLVITATVATGAWFASAGDLNPPVGPITPTHKSLTEVEPRIAINAVNTPGDNDATPSIFKITQPGSYYLAGNITGVAGKRGVEIDADGVTLDLNGFAVVGVGGSSDGVSVQNGHLNLIVLNGTVRGWGADGVNLSLAGNSQIRHVLSVNNAGAGIRVGTHATVLNSQATNNGAGMIAFRNCTFDGCLTGENLGHGFACGENATISGSAAHNNAGDGINATIHALIRGCRVTSNSEDGIHAEHTASIFDCVAANNLGMGIRFGPHGTVTECSVNSNQQVGILASQGCTITHCNSTLNALDGIEVFSRCRVVENNCNENGVGAGSGAGIHVTGSGNRIEANNCGNNDRGIEFGFAGNNTAGTKNFLIKNSVTGATGGVPGNYVFHPLGVQNTYGEILNFTAGGQVNETNSHSWANFEY